MAVTSTQLAFVIIILAYMLLNVDTVSSVWVPGATELPDMFFWQDGLKVA